MTVAEGASWGSPPGAFVSAAGRRASGLEGPGPPGQGRASWSPAAPEASLCNSEGALGRFRWGRARDVTWSNLGSSEPAALRGLAGAGGLRGRGAPGGCEGRCGPARVWEGELGRVTGGLCAGCEQEENTMAAFLAEALNGRGCLSLRWSRQGSQCCHTRAPGKQRADRVLCVRRAASSRAKRQTCVRSPGERWGGEIRGGRRKLVISGEVYNSESVTGPRVEWPSEMRRTPSCMNGTEWGCSRQMSQSEKGTRDQGICRGVVIASNHQLCPSREGKLGLAWGGW